MTHSFQSLQEFVEAIIGTYSPVTYTDASGVSIIPAGLAGVDFSYLFRIIIFCLVVYCIFKVIGGIVCKNF